MSGDMDIGDSALDSEQDAPDVEELEFPPPEPPEDEAQAAVPLAELNEPQIQAAAHVDGPLVVFAGAGSGKTRVITYRIANLVAVHRVPPYRILAVTFTNKAAGEMRRRLGGLLGEEVARDLWVGTFHATCAKLLRRHHEAAGLRRDFVIYDDGDQRAVINRVYKDLGIDDKRYPKAQVLGRIHRAKQEGVRAEDFIPGDFTEDVVARCYPAYAARLKASNAVDFDDLLLEVLRLAEDPTGPAGIDLRRKFRYVLVDEFQDVNTVQYRLIRAMSREHGNLCVVGDDDQSIYRWRGADVRIMRSFRADHPNAVIVKLEQNYRSTSNVVSSALGVIRMAKDREPKELWTANPPGEPVSVVATSTERDEAAFVVEHVRKLVEADVSPAEIALFYRMHAQSRVLEEVMRAERIPYQVIGGVRFFERAEVKDLLSYLRVLVNPTSDVDLLRIINVPSRKIGDTTIEKLTAIADAGGLCLYDAIVPLCESSAIGPQPKKSLARFHAMLEELRGRVETASPRELAEAVLEESGYAQMLKKDDSPEAEARLLNLEELVGAIGEYEDEVAAAGDVSTLSGWLERVTLSTSADEMKDTPKVALMTVHAAKGLEFSYVFLTGMEEDTFPFRSQDPTRQGDDEEERRLAYVAITRARQKLWVTHAQRRMLFGGTRYNLPSRFIADLPADAVVQERTDTMRASEGRFIDRDDWGHDRRGQPGTGPARPKLAWSHPQEHERRSEQTPASSRQAGERFVERDDEVVVGFGRRRAPVAPGSLGPGTRVAHRSFGIGTVQGVDDGEDPTATVKFSGWSAKRIKVRFLERVDD